jgi:hypothetical protein
MVLERGTNPTLFLQAGGIGLYFLIVQKCVVEVIVPFMTVYMILMVRPPLHGTRRRERTRAGRCGTLVRPIRWNDKTYTTLGSRLGPVPCI